MLSCPIPLSEPKQPTHSPLPATIGRFPVLSPEENIPSPHPENSIWRAHSFMHSRNIFFFLNFPIPSHCPCQRSPHWTPEAWNTSHQFQWPQAQGRIRNMPSGEGAGGSSGGWESQPYAGATPMSLALSNVLQPVASMLKSKVTQSLHFFKKSQKLKF